MKKAAEFALWARTLIRDGCCTELRIFPMEGGVVAGFFTEPDSLVEAVSRWDGLANIYATLNPVRRELLARAANRWVHGVRSLTTDADIAEVRWIPVDIDPVRPAKTNSTDAELQAAVEVRDEIAAYLRERGATPVRGISGNGAHVLVPIHPIPPSESGVVASVLRVLKAKFGNERVNIDTTVANPSRIWRFYGTLNMKGEESEERPHRWSRLVLAELLEAAPVVIGQILSGVRDSGSGVRVPEPEPRIPDPAFNSEIRNPKSEIDKWLTKRGIGFRRKDKDGLEVYELKRCPFNPEHNRGEAAIFVAPLSPPNIGGMGGRVSFKCHHNSCSEYTWEDAKIMLEGRGAIETVSYSRVIRQEYTKRHDFIAGILTEGLTLLAGPPKIGKSWLALGMAVTVAQGGEIWGKAVEQSGVLYAALEDSQRRLAERLATMGLDEAAMGGFRLVFKMPPLDWRGLEALEQAMDDSCRVVFIDTWKKVKPQAQGGGTLYDEEYETLGRIREFAVDRGIAVVLVHHTRKMVDSSNVLNEISGSTGVQAPADGLLVLKKVHTEDDERKGRLYITGRDLEEDELTLVFNDGAWSVTKMDMTLRERVIELLREEPGLTPKEIIAALEVGENSIRPALSRMVRDGIVSNGHGKYTLIG